MKIEDLQELPMFQVQLGPIRYFHFYHLYNNQRPFDLLFLM